jgi:hypothetical protein
VHYDTVNSLWCAVGTSGEIQTSPDGITWTARTAAGGFSGLFRCVTHDQVGLWCIAGANGEIQTSPDGITWTARTADNSYTDSFLSATHDGKGTFILSGEEETVQTSFDGITWTQRYFVSGSATDFYGIYYGDLHSVLTVGTSGEAFKSLIY